MNYKHGNFNPDEIKEFIFTNKKKEVDIMFNLEIFTHNAPKALINIKLYNKIIQSSIKFIKYKETSLNDTVKLLKLMEKLSNEIEEEIEKTGI